MTIRLPTMIGLALLCGAGAAQADGDAKTGAQKIRAFGCIACHGRDGVSKLPEAPNLAGQVETYLAAALKSYQSGARKNELMNTVTEKLNEADIADLAAYYAGISVTVAPPPKP